MESVDSIFDKWIKTNNAKVLKDGWQEYLPEVLPNNAIDRATLMIMVYLIITTTFSMKLDVLIEEGMNINPAMSQLETILNEDIDLFLKGVVTSNPEKDWLFFFEIHKQAKSLIVSLTA